MGQFKNYYQISYGYETVKCREKIIQRSRRILSSDCFPRSLGAKAPN